jgi:hypothetical protein
MAAGIALTTSHVPEQSYNKAQERFRRLPAIAVQYLFELAERAVVPRSLRMATRT